MRRLVGLVVGTVALAGALAGCSAAGVSYERVTAFPTDAPIASIAPEDMGTPLALAHGADALIVVVWGSSSCRPTPTGIDAGGAVPVITFAADSKGGAACTADLTSTMYSFPVSELGGAMPAKVVIVTDGVRSTVTVVD